MDILSRSAPRNAATSTSPGCTIDLAHLARYTMGNSELEREVLGLFAEQAPTVLQSLRQASSARAWREAAHTLRGAALAVGAWRVAHCGQKAEVAEFSPGNHDAVLAELDIAIAEAVAFIARRHA